MEIKSIFSSSSPLTLNALIEKINKIGKGTFAHLEYYSEPKTIDGSKIYKVCALQIRTKIDRTNKKDYVEPTYHRTEDSEYLISNALKTNNKTGNTLFCVNPVWEHYTTKYFNADKVEITEEQAKAIIKPKAQNGEIPDFITVNASKVLALE